MLKIHILNGGDMRGSHLYDGDEQMAQGHGPIDVATVCMARALSQPMPIDDGNDADTPMEDSEDIAKRVHS
jgi:hypothetical protein